MKILMTTEQFPPEIGGVGAVAHGFAIALAARGQRVAVLATSRKEANWTVEEDCRIRGLPGGGRRWLKLVPMARAIRKILLTEKPDIVFASAYRPTGLPAAFWGSRLEIPVVFYAHGSEFLTEKHSLARMALLRSACSKASAIVANSSNTGSLVQRTIAPARCPPMHIIHPGINIHRFPFCEEPAGAPVILTLSSATRRKGGDLVLHAAARLRKTCFPDLRVIMGGDGPYLPELKAMAKDLDLGDSVEWLHWVHPEKVPQLMARCTLFVLASRDMPRDLESFGIVYIEAGATGRAVIGTRVGGIAEAVIDGKTGRLIPPENPDALAAAIGELLDHPEERRALAQEGRRHAEALDWAIQTALLEEIFAGLIKTQKNAGFSAAKQV